MPSYDKTQLWHRSLAANVEDSNAAARERLRSAYERLRERAQPVAEVIARDLPDYTIHDITHLDALWEYADLVAGADYQLTPCEAFVLGGAFLIHDLGMGLAAYPNGLAGLKKLPLWKDTVASVLRKRGQEEVTAADVTDADENAHRDATAEVLRVLHASRAEELALLTWKNGEGDPFHLIEDPELRASFGPLIGRIAHSHWWPVEQLTHEFPTVIGAPGGFPGEWSVDPLKLACIIRGADYCHLDDRRAPAFVRAIQRPSKDSAPHWQFQSKLYQPRLEVDRLVYTAKSAFSPSEAPAWWICYDTLTGLDTELRKVDSILADTKRDRLAARGVAHAEDPSRLAKIIRTDGWYPVDTRIRVTAVANLVQMLGGEQLYGDDIAPPMRELMQNGADAIRARRLLESRADDWGTLTVKHGTDSTGPWIEVEDSGVGMSQAVLTSCLLDFGTSFWGSRLMHTELPGLDSKGYNAVGRYGIGFFSAFMWGDKVQVVTQRYDAAKSDTLTLEFTNGLSERPLLRKAVAEEYIQDAGTKVRVWLKDESILSRLLGKNRRDSPLSLMQVCTQIAPCLDVSVVVIEQGAPPTIALSAADWMTVDEETFCDRLPSTTYWRRKRKLSNAIRFRPPLTLVRDDDERVWGRAAIWPAPMNPGEDVRQGAVVVGGFYATNLNGIMGVLLGRSRTAARDVGIPTIPAAALKRWATEESNLRLAEGHESEFLAEIAQVLRQFDVDVSKYPFVRTKGGWITGEQVAERATNFKTAYVVLDAVYDNMVREDGEFELNDNVFVVEAGLSPVLARRISDSWPISTWPSVANAEQWGEHQFFAITLFGAVVESLAKGWDCSLESVLKESSISSDDKALSGEIGVRNGSPVLMEHLTIIRKPDN
ncbi:MAG: ATP-binding protein [Planctomycetaceae bacterium]